MGGQGSRTEGGGRRGQEGRREWRMKRREEEKRRRREEGRRVGGEEGRRHRGASRGGIQPVVFFPRFFPPNHLITRRIKMTSRGYLIECKSL